MGTYITPSAPTGTPGFFVKPESAIKIGTGRKYASLDNTSWTYTTYEISIGLRAGTYTELGLVAGLSFRYQPTIEPVDSANTADASVYTLTGEETTVSVEIQEFKPAVLAVAFSTGTTYTLGDESVTKFGGGCNANYRPISIEFINMACDAPTSANIANGITGGCLTLYDTICSSGIDWNMVANEVNTLPLEFDVMPVIERTKGGRLGSLYIY